VQSIGASEFSLENLRKRLQDMSDEELIQFGKACKDMLTPQANLGRPPREVFVIQFRKHAGSGEDDIRPTTTRITSGYR
jgi:hypothetical protein